MFNVTIEHVIDFTKKHFDDVYSKKDFEPSDISFYAYYAFKHDGISHKEAMQVQEVLAPNYPRRSKNIFWVRPV